jgi:sugar phosphate isomerase/epimerase
VSDWTAAARPFVSTGAFRTRSLAEIVASAAAGGLGHIELGSGTEWAPDMLRPVHETAARGVRYLVHNYFPPHETPFVLNLAAADAEVLARSEAHCRAAVDLSATLGAPFFSVHAGFAFSARPEQLGHDLTGAPRIALEEAHAIFVQALRRLCAYAAARVIDVVVENNVIAPFNLVNGRNLIGLCATAEEALRTQAEVGAPNFGFLVDTGHLKVTANALGFDGHRFLDDVGPHVRAFHLSDNDGTADQNYPFDATAWFVPRLAEFPRATMVLEAYKLDVETIRATCQVIERARERAVAR